MSNLTFVHFMVENHFWESKFVQPKKRALITIRIKIRYNGDRVGVLV